MRTVFAVLAALLVSANLQAQTVVVIGPASVIEWTVAGVPDPVAAAGLKYGLTVDTLAPKILTAVTCTQGPAALHTCTTPVIGNAPIGAHTLWLTSSDGTTTSLPSAPFSYLTMIVPVPAGLRIR